MVISRRRIFRRRTRLNRRYRRRFVSKVLRPRIRTLRNKTKGRLNIPLNPRYLTKFTFSMMGVVPPGDGHTDGLFVIRLNSPSAPLLTNPTFTSTSNNNGVLLGGITSGTNARAFSNLVSSSMYNKYRVYASRIKLTIIPRSVLDTTLVTVVPTTHNQGSQTQTAVLDQNVAFSKEKIVSSNADMGNNTIISYIDMPSLDGQTKQQFMADENKVGVLNQAPQDLSLWVIKYINTTNANYNSALSFNIEVVYYTELFEVNFENMNV